LREAVYRYQSFKLTHTHTHYTLGHDKTTYARDLWTLLTVMHINTRSPKLRYDTIWYDSRV